MKILRSSFWVCIATLIPALVLADRCAEIADEYSQKIMPLQSLLQDALSRTTDPNQQAGIRQSYQWQIDQLKMQRDAALVSAGCSVEVDQKPDIDPPPPEVEPDDQDPEVDPEEDPACVPNPQQPVSCKVQLDAYIALLKTMKLHPCEFNRRVWAKTYELQCFRRWGWWGRGWGWGWGHYYGKPGVVTTKDNCGNVVKKPVKRHFHWHYCWWHHRMCYHKAYKHDFHRHGGHRGGMPKKCDRR
jgi:hypothetical protein